MRYLVLGIKMDAGGTPEQLKPTLCESVSEVEAALNTIMAHEDRNCWVDWSIFEFDRPKLHQCSVVFKQPAAEPRVVVSKMPRRSTLKIKSIQ